MYEPNQFPDDSKRHMDESTMQTTKQDDTKLRAHIIENITPSTEFDKLIMFWYKPKTKLN